MVEEIKDQEAQETVAKEAKSEFNEDYDDKYEDWWSNDGKAAFDAYMKKPAEEAEEDNIEEV